ncbi:MAG: hypothetical protein AAF288_02410 [Planctomycetota bacterium]
MRYSDRLARKQPSINWANGIDDVGSKFEARGDDARVYLIDEVADISDPKKVLRRCWKNIFEEELNAWLRDTPVWPKRRSYAVFMEWFEVELCDMVMDLGRWSIAYDSIGQVRRRCRVGQVLNPYGVDEDTDPGVSEERGQPSDPQGQAFPERDLRLGGAVGHQALGPGLRAFPEEPRRR